MIIYIIDTQYWRLESFLYRIDEVSQETNFWPLVKVPRSPTDIPWVRSWWVVATQSNIYILYICLHSLSLFQYHTKSNIYLFGWMKFSNPVVKKRFGKLIIELLNCNFFFAGLWWKRCTDLTNDLKYEF